MSAILSADDLNDFISPGVACIKPVETLPKQQPLKATDSYEVTTEEELAASAPPPPAQISLTDCLACSGCVTSAEAVLVSLQSHQEVLDRLDVHPSITSVEEAVGGKGGMLFVASVSPQTRANIAVTYGVSEKQAGFMIEQLLSGPQGLRCGGRYGSGFTWVVDTNTVREICQEAVVEEVRSSLSSGSVENGLSSDTPKLPILASACPGWICYAEKTHSHVIPHLSRLKSPQAMTGTLLKSVLSRRFKIAPDRVWHLAIMPCFDKKLEASRKQLTDTYWMPNAEEKPGVRDVDCVITARELIMLADTRGISFPRLPRTPVVRPPFPDAVIDSFLFRRHGRYPRQDETISGPSGGYAYEIIKSWQAQTPSSEIRVERGRGLDAVEYNLLLNGKVILKTARHYGFKNITNVIRKLKPAKKSRMPGAKLAGSAASPANGLGQYAYVEVMACPGGCTNGGGQIKVDDVGSLRGDPEQEVKLGPAERKEWLALVDEAYFSADSSGDENDEQCTHSGEMGDMRHSGTEPYTKAVVEHWASSTGIQLDKLLFTTYEAVDSDVGKENGTSDMERVAGLASSHGGGW